MINDFARFSPPSIRPPMELEIDFGVPGTRDSLNFRGQFGFLSGHITKLGGFDLAGNVLN